jgi:hypothetical protein
MIPSRSLFGVVSLKILCVLLLLWALNPNNPYGYYVLLRWICSATFAYLAFHSFQSRLVPWVWVFGTAAGLYNPIFSVHLDRTIWSVVNVVTIALLLTSHVAEWRHHRK